MRYAMPCNVKVSRDHTWRRACVSTIGDTYDRWLYCLVRLSFHFGKGRLPSRNQ